MGKTSRLTLTSLVGACLLVFASACAENEDTPSVPESPSPSIDATIAETEAPGPTATPAEVPSPTVPASEVDATGWPIVDCPDGFPVMRVETRRISGCAPPGLTLREQHEYGEEGPGGMIRLALLWDDPENPGSFVALQVIDKATANRENLQSRCEHPTQAVLLGHSAEQCVWSPTSPNGEINGLWGIVWGVERFAESPDYWLIANSSGPQIEDEQVAAIERAVAVFDSFLANGLAQTR